MPDEPIVPAAVVPDSQPDASPPASDPPSDAPETTPAVTGEPPPADGAVAPDADALALSDEDKAAFIDLYGDAFADHPKFKEIVDRGVQAARDREKAEASTNRDNDPLYRELNTAFQAESQRLTELADALRIGDDVDPDDLMQGISTATEWAEATERRGQTFLANAILQRTLGIDDGRVDPKNPLHKQYQEVIAEQNEMLQNVYRLRKSGNPQQRAQASMADATAAATFIDKYGQLMMAAGEQKGITKEQTRSKKTTEAAIHTARSNTMTEAIAKAQAVALAGRGNGVGGGGAGRSDAELLTDPTTPVTQLAEIRRRQRNGG